MLRTRFTEMFGIRYPVMSAAFVSAVRPAAEVLRTVCDAAEAVLRSRPGQLVG